MSAINSKVAHDVPEHIDVQRGNAGMETPRKEFKFGNAKGIIVSPLMSMTPEEQKQWFDEEWKKGNPVLKQIADAVVDCYEK